MNWERAKKTADAQVLDGVRVEIDRTDSSINSVTLTDAKGGALRIINNSYNMYVEIPAKPKFEKKFAVVGEIKGVKVDETFESEYAAKNRVSDLGYDAAVTVSEVDVEIPF